MGVCIKMEFIKNEVTNAIMERRSVRGYSDEPITQDELYTLLQCGLWAPSGRNSQSTKFAVLQGKEILQELQNDVMAFTEKPSKWMSNGFYYNAPCLIFLFGKKGDRWTGINAACAAENIHLAAHSLGLSSIIIGIIREFMLSENAKKWIDILKMPEDHEFCLAVAVGHGTDPGMVLKRKEGNLTNIEF